MSAQPPNTVPPESSRPESPQPDSSGDKLDRAVLQIAGVVVLGAIMSILDVTVVNVALPTFQQDFGATYAVVAWTMTAYTLALATVIPLTGWAADRFGTKRLYIAALVLFVLGSVLCSTAWDITSLITFRVVQGLGGGMLMPLGMTIMTRAAGPERVGRVMAVLGIPMLLGPIAGPILGGWLIEIASWHWIFLINVPIGVVALVAAIVLLPSDSPESSESFDFVGMLLLSPGLALFLFGVSSVPETGTIASARVLVPACVGALLIVAFVFHALRTEHPLIDLRLFANRSLTVAVLTAALFVVAFMGSALLLPTYFLQVRGETTLQAGLLLAPQGIGAMVTMPIAGRLVDRIGPGRIVMTGVVVIAGAMAYFTQLGADTPYSVLLPVLFVMGLGMGCTMMPIMTAALQTLTHRSVARGSTLMNINQQISASIGTALMSVLLTNHLQSRELAGAAIASRSNPEIVAGLGPEAISQGFQQAADAFGSTYIVAFGLVVATLVPAFFLPRSRPVRPAGDPAAAAPVH
ncbi:DHA2 family efflux MFS transporter permease subunit [Rhodococcus rhodnii]|uniref:Major facilitator superfamily multidrug n=2 Tax=Rhodococcus rhodnii TaxID=38312 RepID=R7WJS7_9NOCA|nr:DHA2 family efflux MFS transporter permease subunit [Rhodococcus rhodnii]EOM75557.1 major facilitator superfamily multidrug [Rhodococcus rhodnii LMG 5362]TXG91910.1 DHA2 family efflux MFS transporter permease subunit [Rhodococcus rhodnii]